VISHILIKKKTFLMVISL